MHSLLFFNAFVAPLLPFPPETDALVFVGERRRFVGVDTPKAGLGVPFKSLRADFLEGVLAFLEIDDIILPLP